MTTGTLALSTGTKDFFRPLICSAMLQSEIYNDQAVAKKRAYLREENGEIAAFFCSARELDGDLCMEDVPQGMIKIFRSIGAIFRAGEEPTRSRIESLVRFAFNKGRPATTLLVIAHTACVGHEGNDREALLASDLFVGEVMGVYDGYRNPNGTRRLMPVKVLVDLVTGAWKIFNGAKSACALDYQGLSVADRSVRVKLAITSLFSDRYDVHPASLRALMYLFEENIKYLESHEGNGTLKEEELRPGVIIAVGKGFPWVKRFDNVYVVEDHHAGYIDDIHVPLGKIREDEVGGFVTGDTFSEILQEPYKKPNAIQRSLYHVERVRTFLRTHYPGLAGSQVIPTIFKWDDWTPQLDPAMATHYECPSWAA